MISVEQAREQILQALRPTPSEVVALANAWNCVTAADITARLAQPPSDVSAMDGYALRAADGTLHASLRVIGAAPAGHPFDGHVGPGETVRLFTGSVVPSGAQCHLAAGRCNAGWRCCAGERGRGRGPAYPPGGTGLRRRRHGHSGRPADYRPRRRSGRGGEPSLADRASPPPRRDPGDRRRDRPAGGPDPRRRHREFQFACPRRSGTCNRRRADDPADRARRTCGH